MPSWRKAEQKIAALELQGDEGPINTVRHKYLGLLGAKTGRITIAYGAGWLSAPAFSPAHVTSDDDKSGFMKMVHKVARQTGLDVVLHTPGGFVTASESIVDYLALRRMNLSKLIENNSGAIHARS